MKKILLATDYSDAAKEALHLATMLASQCDAMLLIVHVTDVEQYPVGELFDENPPIDQDELARLKTVVPKDPAVAYEHRLLHGPVGSAENVHPSRELIKVAESERPLFVVLGTHGRSGISHVLMGSVAEKVLHANVHCPVIVVKPAAA